MPIDSYTTKIGVNQTVSQIQNLLASKGASRVMVEYTDGKPAAVSFTVWVDDTEIPFRLPTKPKRVFDALVNDSDVPKNLKTWEQANRVVWRQVLKWIQAQIAFVEADQATMPELFLPHAVMGGGKTVYQTYIEDRKLLTEGRMGNG